MLVARVSGLILLCIDSPPPPSWANAANGF